jgi:hypothetical protein
MEGLKQYAQLGTQSAAIPPKRADNISSTLTRINVEIDRLFTYAQRLSNIADNIDGPKPTGDTNRPEQAQRPSLVGSTEHILYRLQALGAQVEDTASRIESALG